MGQRLTNKAWLHLKENFPDDIDKLTCVNFKINKSNITFFARRYYRVRKGKKIKKTNIERFGHEVGSLLDWLDDVASGQYYIDLDRQKPIAGSLKVTIKFYFFEESDAIAFKLVFGEKDLTAN